MSYLTKAISSIYGEQDDFIIIGLTGRTGSGCTTAANLLTKNFSDIKNSLYKGSTPESNEQRKEKIIQKRAQKTWAPFIHIQASTILTIELAKAATKSEKEFSDFLKLHIECSEESISKALAELEKAQLNPLNASNDFIKKIFEETLPETNKKLSKILGKANFVKIFQKIGKNIRGSGCPFSEEILPGKFTTVSEKIDSIIKSIRKNSKSTGLGKTYIVIDAIRNPFEAAYFQDRYSSFYLIAVSCLDDERKKRLRLLGYSDNEIEKIDAAEHPEGLKLGTPLAYIAQDIPSCLQIADLHINNKTTENRVSEFFHLANQLIRFVTLMRYPGTVTPTALERCMQIAHTAKLNSGCISRQVGAVVTDENFSVKCIGWNDTPKGQVPCNLRNRADLEEGLDQSAYSDFEKKSTEFIEHIAEKTIKLKTISTNTGRNLSFCFKSEYNKLKNSNNQVFTRSLHAEENAFLQITKYGGQAIEGGKLFTTASPCELCSKKAYQLGIKEIYYIDPYPGIAINHILMGGIQNPELILFSGAIGRAFHNLYTPKPSYKDELDTLAESQPTAGHP